jgi:hypothetical protein
VGKGVATATPLPTYVLIQHSFLWHRSPKYEHDAQASGCLGVTHLLALRARMSLSITPFDVAPFTKIQARRASEWVLCVT